MLFCWAALWGSGSEWASDFSGLACSLVRGSPWWCAGCLLSLVSSAGDSRTLQRSWLTAPSNNSWRYWNFIYILASIPLFHLYLCKLCKKVVQLSLSFKINDDDDDIWETFCKPSERHWLLQLASTFLSLLTTKVNTIHKSQFARDNL